MPVNFLNERLLDAMAIWNVNNVAAGVILVDETTTDTNVSTDRASAHHMQAALLARAIRYGFPIYLVKYGYGGAHGVTGVFGGGISATLDAAIPNATPTYDKGALETNGFDNVQLQTDVGAANLTHIVIMGQSVNACCEETARGAAALGLNVHTCYSVIRGGGTATRTPEYYTPAFGWPDGTSVYAQL